MQKITLKLSLEELVCIEEYLQAIVIANKLLRYSSVENKMAYLLSVDLLERIKLKTVLLYDRNKKINLKISIAEAIAVGLLFSKQSLNLPTAWHSNVMGDLHRKLNQLTA